MSTRKNNMSMCLFTQWLSLRRILRIKKNGNNSNNSQQDERRVVSIFIYTVTHINK